MRRIRIRQILACLGILFILTASGIFIAYRQAYGDLKSWVESSDFQNLLSHQVSRALKVHGQFGEITLVEGLTARAESFESTGRAGEAIGSLNAYGIRGTFNPGAMLRNQWKLDRVDIERGQFVLRMPDDALKEPLPGGDPPWYHFLMPEHFNCGIIVCPQAEVQFPFRGQKGRLSDLYLEATMVGQDFKYHGRDGRLNFPYFPPMHVETLRVFVTREMADIEEAVLVGMDDDSRAEIQARIGMREDKSIQADVAVSKLPLEPVLPDEWRSRLAARLSGDIKWSTDKQGESLRATGALQLNETRLENWSWLDELARLHGNASLRSLAFEDVTCQFTVENKAIEVATFAIHAPELIKVTGNGDYDWGRKRGRVDLDLEHVPLHRWLPDILKPRLQAVARGHLTWEGPLDDTAAARASGTLDLSGAVIRNPIRFQEILAPYGIHVPNRLTFVDARLDFDYANLVFEAHLLYLETRDNGTVSVSGNWTDDDRLTASGSLTGVELERWVEESGPGELGGTLWVSGDWTCIKWDAENGDGSGWIGCERGWMLNWDVQKDLARFFKDVDWLELQFDPIRIPWKAKAGDIQLREIELRGSDRIGIRGHLRRLPDNRLEGELEIGLREEDLTWLPGATRTVFDHRENGLHWATTSISGTVDEPKHDLGDQVLGQLRKHPLALLRLGIRGLSWWLGDVLGTYEGPDKK